MNMFAVQNKAKSDMENITGLKLAVVKLTTVQKTKLPLLHKICKLGLICSVRPILEENLCVVQKEEFSITYVRYVHLMKGQAYS
jgi:hypothetical protein